MRSARGEQVVEVAAYDSAWRQRAATSTRDSEHTRRRQQLELEIARKLELPEDALLAEMRATSRRSRSRTDLFAIAHQLAVPSGERVPRPVVS